MLPRCEASSGWGLYDWVGNGRLGRGKRRLSVNPKAARLRGVRFGRQAQVTRRSGVEKNAAAALV